MEWIATPAGIWVLFFIAVAESSFFPIPPDVFLIALCLSVREKTFTYALVCSIGSVLGGAIGYGLGLGFMDTIGQSIITLYGGQGKYDIVQDMYRQYQALAIFAAGFTPLPYKLFTITAGAFKINFPLFIVISLASRAARFYLVAGLIYYYGAPVQYFIKKYFNILTIVFMLLLLGGFIVLKIIL